MAATTHRIRQRVFLSLFLFFITVLAGGLLAGALTAYVIIRSELDTGAKIDSLATSDFQIDQNGQVRTREVHTTRAGCLGADARVLARLEPDGSIDEQALTAIPFPVGIDASCLRQAGCERQIQPVSKVPKTQVFHRGLPLPTGLQPGHWVYVIQHDQPSCGWVHSLLPIQSTLTYGPAFDVGAIQPSGTAPGELRKTKTGD